MEEKINELKNENKVKKIILNVIYYLVLIVLILLLGMRINFSKVVVDGQSMYPTLIGDSSRGYEYGYTDRYLFKITGLDRYDIVVVKVERKNAEDLWIKRIIGMPNETIQIKEGEVYINDELLETDTFCADPIINPGIAVNPITLGENQYFVMGDNRNNSKDSRSYELGLVDYDQIYGHGFISRGFSSTTDSIEVITKHWYDVKGW